MSDTLVWFCESFWNRVLIVAIILVAAAITASLLWIAIYAVLALRNRLKDLNNHNNVAKRRKR